MGERRQRKVTDDLRDKTLYTSVPGREKSVTFQRNFIRYRTAFQSDLYRIIDFNCFHDAQYIFPPNYTDVFRINMTRRGYFTFESFNKVEEEYRSRISIEKPDCEYRVVQRQPGEGGCTMFRFTQEGYEAIQDSFGLRQNSFFSNENVFNTMLHSDAETDFLHHCILQQLTGSKGHTLQLDCLVMDLVHVIMQRLLSKKCITLVPSSIKRLHVKTIERAKEFLLDNFRRDILLLELARYCYVSPFHFTRLFKQFCGCSPFSYLQQVRLKHAEMLIRTTNLPVADVCIRSGFNSLDYFSATFAKLYGVSPTQYKLKLA